MHRPKMDRWEAAVKSPETNLEDLVALRDTRRSSVKNMNQSYEWGYLEGRIDERRSMLTRFAKMDMFGDDLKPRQYMVPYIPKMTFMERLMYFVSGKLPSRFEEGVAEEAPPK